MRTMTRSIAIALAITATVMLSAGSAAANRSLSVEPAGAIRITSIGKMTFEEPGILGLACNLTLSGTLSTTAPKTAGVHVGSITEGRTTECIDTILGTRGAATVLAEPNHPFDVVYNSFLGTLPRITGILVRSDGRYLIRAAAGECLYETGERREGAFLFEAEERGGVERGGFLASERIRLFRRLSGECPAGGELRGSFRIEPRQRVTLL